MNACVFFVLSLSLSLMKCLHCKLHLKGFMLLSTLKQIKQAGERLVQMFVKKYSIPK